MFCLRCACPLSVISSFVVVASDQKEYLVPEKFRIEVTKTLDDLREASGAKGTIVYKAFEGFHSFSLLLVFVAGLDGF